MNLDCLRNKILSATTTAIVGGATYRLAKLGATDGIKVSQLLASIQMRGEGDQRQIANPEDMVRFYSLLLSLSLLNDKADRPFDSDEGRALLERLPRDEFIEIGEAAANWNLPDAKKN